MARRLYNQNNEDREYRGPRWIFARFESNCGGCLSLVLKGQRVMWHPYKKAVYCVDCSDRKAWRSAGEAEPLQAVLSGGDPVGENIPHPDPVPASSAPANGEAIYFCYGSINGHAADFTIPASIAEEAAIQFARETIAALGILHGPLIFHDGFGSSRVVFSGGVRA